ncbi:ABC transporter ATP-binding protein [Coprothermobacteraceae bacterium]|nr:ABC transporter ATP-binding protein [Coprothermobacteraceae bacterium]
MEAIVTRGLTKYYGATKGIEDLDLEVQEGTIFGYLGPNGAGKTTTIRLIMQSILPTRGEFSIFGKLIKPGSYEYRSKIGYVPGELSLYENMTGWDYVLFASRLRNHLDRAYVRALAERFQVDLSVKIKQLSKGNKQKVGIIQALAHKPKLLVLDEPTAGLDPFMQEEFYKLLIELQSEGVTVFFSSHILSEVSKVCERVGILREGKLIALESVDALRSKSTREVKITFASPVRAELFSGIPNVVDLELRDNEATLKVVGSMDPLLKRVSEYEVVDFLSREPSLEEIFFAFYGSSFGKEGGMQ